MKESRNNNKMVRKGRKYTKMIVGAKVERVNNGEKSNTGRKNREKLKADNRKEEVENGRRKKR